jgi:ribose transport system substrate-binding protein
MEEKMKKRLVYLCVVLSAFALLMSGCKKQEPAAPAEGAADAAPAAEVIEVGLVMKNYNSPYFQALTDTVKTESEKLGWSITVLGSDNDVTKEAANMDSLIQKGVKVIFLDCLEPDPVVPAINRAAEAGIPVIAIDSGVGAAAQTVTTVYSNNVENGRAVGKAYIAYKGMDTPIVAIMLSGTKGNIAGLERRSGAIAGIIGSRLGLSDADADAAAAAIEEQLVATGKAENAEAKFSIVGQGWGDWSRTGGLQAGEDLITANKDTLTLVMGENDEMVLGARQALVNAEMMDIDLIASADGSKAAYDLMKTGELPRYIATGENSPVKVGMKAVEIAKQIVDGAAWTDFQKITTTDAFGVTADMVDAHYDFGF